VWAHVAWDPTGVSIGAPILWDAPLNRQQAENVLHGKSQEQKADERRSNKLAEVETTSEYSEEQQKEIFMLLEICFRKVSPPQATSSLAFHSSDELTGDILNQV